MLMSKYILVPLSERCLCEGIDANLSLAETFPSMISQIYQIFTRHFAKSWNLCVNDRESQYRHRQNFRHYHSQSGSHRSRVPLKFLTPKRS